MSTERAQELLADFPIVAEQNLRFSDIDAYGHVNNAVYLHFFESARMAYLERIGLLLDLDNPGVGPILAATQVQYRLPLHHPDTVMTGARISTLDNRWFEMEYRVVSVAHGKVAADGSGRVVVYDYAKRSKTELPDAARVAVANLEKLT